MELEGIDRIVYDNGLTLLMENRPDTRKASLIAGVRVGSVDEELKVNGGSHFNEHLLFKSNPHRTARQISEDLEYSGTVINAYTTWKYTAFTAKALADHLETAIEVLYEAATNYVYDANEFETERQVICTEIENCINSPEKYSMMGLFIPRLYRDTPLEKKIEGTVKMMGSVSREELEDFKRRYYVPNNIVISAVGKFDKGKLEETVRNYFGGVPPGKIPERCACDNLKNSRQEYIEGRRDISQVYMCLGYRVPGNSSADAHKLEMLSSLLSEGLSSRLYTELREKRGIGYGVGSIYCPLESEGIFLAHVDGFDPKRLEETKEVILGVFDDLKTREVPDREFEGTKTLMLSKYYDQIERITERSMMLLETELYDIPYDFREREKYIKGITKEDVMETAEKYLGDDYTLTVLSPECE